jgi:hypothetical protein
MKIQMFVLAFACHSIDTADRNNGQFSLQSQNSIELAEFGGILLSPICN